jgi:Hint domain
MFMQNAKSFLAAEKVALQAAGVIPAPDAALGGILAGSLIETDTGWLRAERLAQGMRVSTWDGGFRAVARVLRHHIWPGQSAGVVHLPGGALGNCADLSLMPGQAVLIDSPVAEDVLGRTAVLVSAAQLDGFRGIHRRSLARPTETITLDFGTEELVYANSGLLIHCPADTGRRGRAADGFFPRLTDAQAAALLALIDSGARTSAEAAGGIRHAA